MIKEQNIKLTIEYDGTAYYGWQKQEALPTIQEEIEKAVRRVIVREDSRINGAGRTDRGVHALGQVANFKTKTTLFT